MSSKISWNEIKCFSRRLQNNDFISEHYLWDWDRVDSNNFVISVLKTNSIDFNPFLKSLKECSFSFSILSENNNHCRILLIKRDTHNLLQNIINC